MHGPDPDGVDSRQIEMLDGVAIPLTNVELTIEQYLLQNGARLDNQTRVLLAGVRDCVSRAAASSRALFGRPGIPPGT